MIKRLVVTGVLLISAGVYSKSLGLQEILKRVEEGNPQVNIQRLGVKIKEKNKKQAFRNLILPPVTLSSEEDWEVIKKDGVGFNEVEAYIPIFQGGRMINGYKRAANDLEISKIDSDLVVYRNQEEAVGRYFESLNFRKQYEVTDMAIRALRKQSDRVGGLYREGKLVPKSEVLKISADIETNRALNLRNRQRELSAKESLYQILGYSTGEELNLLEFYPEKYMEDVGIRVQEGKTPKETKLGKREELTVVDAQYDLKIAKADFYPTIYIKPSYTFRENRGGNMESVNEGLVELGISYTLEWGGTLDRVAQKKYQLEQAELIYDNNIKGIELSIRDKKREIESLYGQGTAAKKRLDFLSENMEIDTLRYDNELLTTFDYLNSVNTLREAQEDYYSLQRELVLAVIQYENLLK